MKPKLHERCFKLQIRFNREETGYSRKISLSFRFMAASFISSLKHSMVLQVAKYLLIFHVPSFYNKLQLVDALFARTQTSFGIGQTV